MRQYLIDNDAAKLRAMAAEGKTAEEIKKALATSGEGVSPRAVDAWIAGTPEIAKKLGVAVKDEPEAKKPKK